VTRKRSNANAEPEPNADAPITGVAAGGLGTAAILDDTQVLRTEDLQAAAAASPGWLDDEAAPAPSAPDLIPPDELALLQTAQNQTPVPPPPVPSVAVVAGVWEVKTDVVLLKTTSRK